MKHKRRYPQPPFVIAKKQQIKLSGEQAKIIISQLDNMQLEDRLLACKNLIGSDCTIEIYIDSQNKISITNIRLFASAGKE